MKIQTTFLLNLLVMLVTACQGGTSITIVAPGPIVVPTVVPTEETAPELTEADAITEPAAEEELTEVVGEAGDTTTGSQDEQIAQMAALSPTPSCQNIH